VESATSLVRDAQDFAESIILLREAKNVTYKLCQPGNLLRLESHAAAWRGESDFEDWLL
jgi:hypothetical protein